MLLILAVTAYIVQYNALQKKADNGVEVAVQEVSPSKEKCMTKKHFTAWMVYPAMPACSQMPRMWQSSPLSCSAADMAETAISHRT